MYSRSALPIIEYQTRTEERSGPRQGSASIMQHHRALRKLILESTGRGFGCVKRVYVVPGMHVQYHTTVHVAAFQTNAKLHLQVI